MITDEELKEGIGKNYTFVDNGDGKKVMSIGLFWKDRQETLETLTEGGCLGAYACNTNDDSHHTIADILNSEKSDIVKAIAIAYVRGVQTGSRMYRGFD